MARLFDDGSSQYLENAYTVSPITVFTMSCWFNSNDATIDQCLFGIADQGSTAFQAQIWARGNEAGDPVSAFIDGSGGGDYWLDTSSGYSANTWHHACLTHTAGSVVLYIDGGSSDSSADDVSILATDGFRVGARAASTAQDYLSGSVAECAYWEGVALTAAEVAVLAKGYSPLLVRPQSLTMYAPLIRNDEDIVGGLSFTANGGPTVSAHPPVRYAVGAYNIIAPAQVAGETLSIAIVPTDSSYDIAKPIIVG